MASRYPSVKVIDYCFNPLHIVDEDKDIIVPCGKCDGCLLHHANELSMRCGMEIEDSAATIFFTLTYNNHYLPKLFPYYSNDGKVVGWYSDHSKNIRFDSVKDVLRKDGIIIPYSYKPIDIRKWPNDIYPAICYMSKRDIQLWLKLLTKDLDNYGFEKIDKRRLFRYFIISEIGPSTFRAHVHGLLFCKSKEVAAYLLEGSLFKNWQMCSESRFVPYAHLCDTGARNYVTQYITGISDLPKIYRDIKEIRPFRLSSKSPAIGYIGQDKKKIYEDIERGIIKYTRRVTRLELNSLLEYPKNFVISLFPKCHGYSKISDSRRFFIYSYLYRAVREFGCDYLLLRKRLCEILSAQDYVAMCRCYEFCRDVVDSPLYYYYLLDMYYYKVDMEHLKSFYESQQNCDFHLCPEKIFEYYPNIEVFCCDEENFSEFRYNSLDLCLTSLGFNVDYLLFNERFFHDIRERIKFGNSQYYKEVSDIKENMIKISKFNEETGNAPTNV